jgi:hypothetical protein
MRAVTTHRSLTGVFAALSIVALLGTVRMRGSAAESPTGPSHKAEVTSQQLGKYVHVALYTFRTDAPEGTPTAFAADADKCFRQIPSVRAFRIGRPAARSTPAAWMIQPQSEYQIGVVLSLDDFEGLAQYGNHQRHNELKQKYAKFFEKIVVYDFEG